MIVVRLFILTLFISLHQCRLPDKVYCANTECNQPISKAKTVLKYNSGDADLMSIPGNADAFVYMKSAGTNSDLWYVKINGKSGFVPLAFLKEMNVYVKNPEHIIPVQVKHVEPNVQPDKVQQAHEVVDGTTIYASDPSVDSQPIQQTSDVPLELTPALPVQEPSGNLNSAAAEVENVSHKISSETPSTEQTIEQIKPVPSLEVTTPLPVDTTVLAENNVEAVTVSSTEEVSPTLEPQVAVTSNIEAVESTTIQESVESLTETAPQVVSTNNNIEPPVQSSPPVETPETLPSPQALSGASGETLAPDTVKVSEDIDLLNSLLSTKADSNEQNVSMNNDNSHLPSIEQSEVEDMNNLEQPKPAAFNDNGLNDDNNIHNVNGIYPPPERIPVTKPKTTTENVVLPPESVVSPNENVVTATENVVSSTEKVVLSTESVVSSTESVVLSKESVVSLNENIEAPTQAIPEIIDIETPTTENVISASTENIESTTETIPAMLISEPTTENVIPVLTENINTIPATSAENFDYVTTEAPLEDISSYTPPPIYDTYSSSENSDVSTTETQSSEENGGFFSSMYTTISEMWPSTTEAPLIDNVFSEDNVAPQIESTDSSSEEGFSFLSYFWSTYNNVMGTEDEIKALFPASGETCFTDEFCDGMGSPPKNRLLTFLLTAAGSTLLFILGYYYIDSKKQDSKFIADINALQRNLMFTSKECELLKEELATTKNKLAGIEDSSFGKDDMVQSLKEEINELKVQNEKLRLSLDDNEKLLRVSENTAGELQNTLGEVENTLSELLGERANSEDQIAELNGKIEALEEELITITRDRDNLQLKYVSAESALEEAKKQNIQLEELTIKLNAANNTVELQRHEIVALKDALKEVKNGLKSDVNVDSLIDHTEIKAKLSKALEEKLSFERKYDIEYKERIRLTEELKKVQESLRTTSQQAKESTNRLDVLGKYFQERESELLKELNAKESLFLSKQGESASTVEKMELLQKEIQRYKEKCDALTLELAEQESAKRSAISELESRAHNLWLECRAAKREVDAVRDEAATLRRRLAARPDQALSPHTLPLPLDSEVGMPPLPPPLGALPPPLPFLPPLPRPPPLGRLPSPLPHRYSDRRYSPHSRYSPESRYSPDTARYSPETRYSPDTRYSPRTRRSPYSPRSRRRPSSRERYDNGRGSRSRNGPADTETEYNSDSPSRQPRRRRYSRQSGPSSGSGSSSESDK